MSNISLVIIAKNEERTIGAALAAAAPVASEIIFVDSGSTDRTLEIAKSYGAKVYQHEWVGYARQKNWAIELATCPWILSLDADEVLTPQVVAEIQKVVNLPENLQCQGYRIPRILYIGNSPIVHGGWYPDAQLRLFKRGAGQFRDRAVHEAIQITGRVGQLKNHMLHYSYANLDGFKQAMEKYARLYAVEDKASKLNKYRLGILDEWFHPLWTFFYRYFLRAGFLDGLLGLKISLIYSDYVYRKIIYSRAAKTRS